TIKGNYVFESMSRITRPISNGELFIDIGDSGPGYGDVLEREPEMVMDDIKKDIISHRTAKEVYFVEYNPETLEVDIEKTEELRQEERKKRLKRGRSYDNFEKEWLQKKPPEEALTWYGSWPDAKKVQDIIRM
ncbi:MAG: hydantoinase B/oxoprolinase family protein, partial [Thermodesulfobacteriota bacterium]|nr:hydantoinase B/oxoprolinase family protein [Thermodesulfobacteriota bacterium]